MNQPGHTPAFVTILVIALIVWRLYMRLRRSVGRQQLRQVRPWFTVTLFPLLIAFFTAFSIGKPLSLLALLGGAALGVGLGIYGLRLTRFEVTPEGLYYTPSAHIGIALSLLLVARIAYRFVVGSVAFAPGGDAPPGQPPLTPLTLIFFGPFAGYYTTYAIGLLRWRFSATSVPAVQPVKPEG
jgi:hypothetical protein